MAGGGGDDNPVSINVTAMVDIIFCLCLFFMCSLHFKQLEGKIEIWMPGPGQTTALTTPPIMEEIRIFMRWSPERQTTVSSVGNRPPAASTEELMRTVLSMKADFEKMKHVDAPVKIDSIPDVPWNDVIRVLDHCHGMGLSQIQFVAP